MSTTQRRMETAQATTADTEYKIAANLEERRSAFRLVYESYLRSGLGEPNPYGLRVTPYHLLPTTEVLIAVLRGETFFTMSLVMGMVFQLPLVMLFFIATGIITPAFFRKYRRHFIVGAVAALAVLTPTGDAMTLLLVSMPVVALYEGGLLLGRLLVRKREVEE